MGFFDQLLKNPHGWGSLPPHPKEIAYEDDAGNSYGFDGGIVKKGTYNTPMTLGETALATATAPAKIATGLASTLSPYGSEGWQVPPVISEPIAAGNRLLNSGGFPDPQDPQNQQDAVTSLLAFFGANAFNPARMAKGTATGAVAKTEPKFRLRFGPWGEDFGETAYLNGTSLKYGPSGIDPNAAYIKSLVTPKAEAGRGQARALMSDLTRQADAEGVPLVLDAQAWDTGTDVRRLRQFYSGLGFEDVDGAGMMRREPSLLSDTSPPMDHASMMARADAQGYAPQTYYHGTNADDLTNFDLGRLGQNYPNELSKQGMFLTPDFNYAKGYGRNVGGYRARLGNNEVVTYDNYGELMRDPTPIQEAKARGADSVTLRHSSGQGADELIMLDPSRVRNAFEAAFDPSKVGQDGFLLSDTKPSILGSILAAENANPKGALASNAVRSAADSLPMDQAQTFNGYHGAAKRGYLENAKARGELWSSSSPDYAAEFSVRDKPADWLANYEQSIGSDFAPTITPTQMLFRKPLVIDAQGRSWTDGIQYNGNAVSTDDVVRQARSAGHDGVVMQNVRDWGSIADEYVALGDGTVTSPYTGEVLFSDTKPSLLGSAIAAEQSKTPGITAYHGSPHDFDKFDLSKIGTGEGAQAYGHGLYFAENEGVAKSYKGASGARYLLVDGDRLGIDSTGKPYALQTPQERALSAVRGKMYNRHYDGDVLSLARDRIAQGDDQEALRIIEGWIDRGAKLDDGHMYQVKINANPEDFLDWDKPLSQQSDNARNALSKLAQSDGGMYGIRKVGNHYAVDTPDGSTVGFKTEPEAKDYMTAQREAAFNFRPDESVGTLIGRLNRSPQLSGAMLEEGIPGIRYLDGNSRGVGEGSSNYVVFDDNLIEILKKYGIIPGLYGASQMGDKRE